MKLLNINILLVILIPYFIICCSSKSNNINNVKAEFNNNKVFIDSVSLQKINIENNIDSAFKCWLLDTVNTLYKLNWVNISNELIESRDIDFNIDSTNLELKTFYHFAIYNSKLNSAISQNVLNSIDYKITPIDISYTEQLLFFPNQYKIYEWYYEYFKIIFKYKRDGYLSYRFYNYNRGELYSEKEFRIGKNGDTTEVNFPVFYPR